MMDNDSQRPQHRQVSSTKPWLLVVMVDGAHSMGADWGGTKRPMSGIVEQAVNQLLYDMALNYSTSEGTDEAALKDRIHLRLLVYSGEDDVDDPIPLPQGSSYLCASGDEGWVRNYSDLHHYPLSSPAEIPRWFEITPKGRTPMLMAFRTARSVIEQHISDYPDSFSPVVLNVSDGEPTDCGDPIDWELLVSECDSIRSLGSEGNRPIICNVHLDPMGQSSPSLYPAEPPLVGGVESGLWLASSKIPGHIAPLVPGDAHRDELNERRFFVFNSDLIHFHEFLNFSTLLTHRQGQDPPAPTAFVLDVDFTEEE